MAKRTATFGLSLPSRDSGAPAYRWLYAALRAEILDGRLRAGSRLPATRDLARQYGLSRGTIVAAFDQLISEGYIEGSVGSGTYVSKVLPDELLQVPRAPASNASVQTRVRPRVSDYGRRVTPFPNMENRPSRAFRPNLPALDLFPTILWAQISARRLRRVSMNLLLGCDAMGYPPLRQAVAEYLSASRGVKCSPEQIAIVSGVQEALDLVTRLMINPGDRVCMEDPGYPGAAFVFESVGAKVRAAGIDDEGIRLTDATLRGSRLVYVTPGHQFPLGVIMSLPRRLALLEWARKSGALIFEDDYDSEYRYSGRPVPALQGLDRDGLVLFSGSFNKVLFPSLRLGYLVIPDGLVDYFAATRSIVTRHAPLLEQAVLCDFISEGHFGRHLRRMREIYAERLSVLLESARQKLSGLLEISSIEAGLQTPGWLADGIAAAAVANGAAARDVELSPLGNYTRGAALEREGFLLGFAAVDTSEIRRGVKELAVVLERRRGSFTRVREPRPADEPTSQPRS